MKTAAQITLAAVALALVATTAPAQAEVKQVGFVSKGSLKKSCDNAGGSYHEDDWGNYTCNKGDNWVSCNAPSKECYGENASSASRPRPGAAGAAKPPSLSLKEKPFHPRSRSRGVQGLQKPVQ